MFLDLIHFNGLFQQQLIPENTEVENMLKCFPKFFEFWDLQMQFKKKKTTSTSELARIYIQ
jgi:hypothetical protein